jgi:hypothetical protein
MRNSNKNEVELCGQQELENHSAKMMKLKKDEVTMCERSSGSRVPIGESLASLPKEAKLWKLLLMNFYNKILRLQKQSLLMNFTLRYFCCTCGKLKEAA